MLLNCHTHFSLGYGTLSPEALLDAVVEYGYASICITDINNTSACLEALLLAQEKTCRVQCGIDFRNGVNQQFIGIAKNNTGFQELNAYLSTQLANRTPFPQEAPEIADAYFVYPFTSYPSRPLKLNEYVGITPQQFNQLKFHPLRNTPDKLVALQSVTFTNKRGFNTHRLLRAIHDNQLLSKLPKTAQATQAETLVSAETYLHQFREYPELIFNTEKLLDACHLSFDFSTNKNKATYTGDKQTDFELLKSECEKGIAYRFGKANSTIKTRLSHELDILQQKDFASYFLINWDLVQYAQHKNYPYVGRGSGANSLVAYLLRITDVEPIELNLYFERFINPYRTTPPDFDIDFSWTDREDVTRYLFHTYGQSHTALLGSYVTFKRRSTIRELGKVFGLPSHEIEQIQHSKNPKGTDNYAEWILKYSNYIAGLPSNLSVHACGILISEKPIHSYCGTFVPPKNYPTTQFDMNVAEDVGLHKFDILSQRGLGKIHDTLNLLKETRGIEIDVHNTHLFRADKKVKQMLKHGDTIGCFYVESPAMRMLLTKLKADDYLRLVAASSIIRPGVAQSGMMREYILRFREPERRKKAQQALPELYNILEETYGVMVYQEDVMKVGHLFGGLTMAQSDILRRGMSWHFQRRSQFEEVQEAFFSNCLKKGYSQGTIQTIWDQIKTFASFAFAKGHSASYAVESFQALYLKAHYPIEYLTACVNNGGGFYSVQLYLHEAKMLGASIEAPCINTSHLLCRLVHPKIFLGLAFINGIDTGLIHRIIQVRKDEPFLSFEDFVERTQCSLEQATLLIRANAFRLTGKDKKTLLWRAHTLISKHTSTPPAGSKLFEQETKQHTLPQLWYHPLHDAFDELELFGFPLCDPQKLLVEPPKQVVLAKELSRLIGKEVTITGYLVHRKRTSTNSGKEMFFGTWLDMEGNWLDTVHFPPIAAKFPFRGRGHYQITGIVVEEYDCIHIEVKHMELLPIQNLENVE